MLHWYFSSKTWANQPKIAKITYLVARTSLKYVCFDCNFLCMCWSSSQASQNTFALPLSNILHTLGPVMPTRKQDRAVSDRWLQPEVCLPRWKAKEGASSEGGHAVQLSEGECEELLNCDGEAHEAVANLLRTGLKGRRDEEYMKPVLQNKTG